MAKPRSIADTIEPGIEKKATFSDEFALSLFFDWQDYVAKGNTDVRAYYDERRENGRMVDPVTHSIMSYQTFYNHVKRWKAEIVLADDEFRKQLNNNIVNERVNAVMKRFIPQLRELQQLAFNQIIKEGYDNSANAVTAYKAFMELEINLMGIPIEGYERINKMNDDQLKDEILRLAGEMELDIKNTERDDRET